MGLSCVHPLDIRRYWLRMNRRCIGFRWGTERPNSAEDVFVGIDNKTPLERVALANENGVENLWYPWDFLHFRRMYRPNRHSTPISPTASTQLQA